MHSSLGKEKPSPRTRRPTSPISQLLLHDRAGGGARRTAPLLVSASGPSTSSCSGAEAGALREGTLRLSDPYLLPTFFWSPGPGLPGLCRSPLAPDDAIKSLQGQPRQPIHLEEPEKAWSHLSHLSASPAWLDKMSCSWVQWSEVG